MKKNDFQFSDLSINFVYQNMETGRQRPESQEPPKDTSESGKAAEIKFQELKKIYTPELQDKLKQKGTGNVLETVQGELDQIESKYNEKMNNLMSQLNEMETSAKKNESSPDKAQKMETKINGPEQEKAKQDIKHYSEMGSPYNAVNHLNNAPEALKKEINAAVFSQTVNAINETLTLMKTFLTELNAKGTDQVSLQEILNPDGMKGMINQAESYLESADQTKIPPQDVTLFNNIKSEIPQTQVKKKETNISQHLTENQTYWND